jgi:beta-galactosidase
VAPRRRTDFSERGLVTPAGDVPFYAGAMHYWRVEPAAWAACLATMRRVGLRLVETYVPWRVHDGRGFTGGADLGRFLDAAHAAGLGVVLRPGPHVNAELTGFGFPDRILANAAMSARTASGTPAFMPAPPRAFAIPSYASTAFQSEVRAWYASVAAVVRPRLAPDGPVVAIGVDNESFFRLGAFDLDYHPDAIAWWAEHAATLGLPADPPRAAGDAGAAAWVRWKDVYAARALGVFSGFLDELGLDVARCHNLAPAEPFTYDLPRLAEAVGGPVGIDVYAARAELAGVRRRALHAVGSSAAVPLALECGVGFFPWFPPRAAAGDRDLDRDQLLTLLAAGVRGFNLFMAVERDRYYGAPIDKRGAVEASWIQPLIAALDAVDWPSLRRATPIAVVASRADTRHGRVTSLVDPMTPLVTDLLGLGADLATDAGATAHPRWFAAIERALALAEVPYAIVDEGAPLERLAAHRAVVVPTFERIDAALLARLHQLPIPIVIGPGTPTRDELDRPLAQPLPRRLGRMRPGSLADLAALAEDLAALAGDPPEHYMIERPDDVDASAFVDPTGATRVVFVQSFVPRAVTAHLTSDPAHTLRDPFNGETFTGATLKLPLPPRGVRMLVVD